MLEIEDLSDKQQERMCVLCEEHICGSRSDSKGNMCEGRWCDQAIEYLTEEIEEENKEIIDRYFKK